MKFDPKCANNKRLTYVSATGHLKPCCWRDPVNDEFNDDKYNLNLVSLQEATISINIWLETELQKPVDAVDECCKRHCVFNINSEADDF